MLQEVVPFQGLGNSGQVSAEWAFPPVLGNSVDMLYWIGGGWSCIVSLGCGDLVNCVVGKLVNGGAAFGVHVLSFCFSMLFVGVKSVFV